MSFRSSFYRHRYIIAVCMTYTIAALAIGVVCNIDFIRFLKLSSLSVLAVFIYLPFLLCALFVSGFWHPNEKLSFSKRLTETDKRITSYFSSPRWYNGVVSILAVTLLLISFCLLKSQFHILAPTAIDASLSQIDHFIHGVYPHEYLLRLVKNFNLGKVFEVIYILWFPVMFLANGFCFFLDKNHVRRHRYLWSYIACWIISGTLLALALYSFGPVYFHLTQSGIQNPYVDLIAWLSTSDDGKEAFSYQAAMYLYAETTDNIRPDVNGISAMPSQHVAISWLIMLYAFKIWKPLGVLAAFYTFLIWLASIILGWHYAIDGYVGIITVTLIWAATGKLLMKREQEYNDKA